jgi:hypothetical protein
MDEYVDIYDFDIGHDISAKYKSLVFGGIIVDFKLNITLAIEDPLLFRILIIFVLVAIKLLG